MGEKYPRIVAVEPLVNWRLFVTFDNGVSKIYDCAPLLETEPFRPLRDKAFFRCAYADPHGYAVVWDDRVDLAESEIWIHGEIADQATSAAPKHLIEKGDRVVFVRRDDEVDLHPLTQTLLDLRGSVPVSGPQDFTAIREQVREAHAQKVAEDTP